MKKITITEDEYMTATARLFDNKKCRALIKDNKAMVKTYMVFVSALKDELFYGGTK